MYNPGYTSVVDVEKSREAQRVAHWYEMDIFKKRAKHDNNLRKASYSAKVI